MKSIKGREVWRKEEFSKVILFIIFMIVKLKNEIEITSDILNSRLNIITSI